jgi:hypothetical protein
MDIVTVAPQYRGRSLCPDGDIFDPVELLWSAAAPIRNVVAPVVLFISAPLP